MKRTYYGTLDVPSTATQSEIRAAYRIQLDRVRTGLARGISPREIERAYATLGSPNRRLKYDVDLAARRVAPVPRLNDSQPAILIAGIAAGALLTVALMLALSLPGRSERPSTAPALAVASPPLSAAPQPQATTPEMAAATPDTPAPAAEASAAPEDQPAPDAVAAAPVPEPVAAAPAPAAAQRAPLAARRAPAYVPASADRVTVGYQPQYSQPQYSQPEEAVDAGPAPEPEQDVTAAAAASAPVAIARPALSSPYGSARTSLRLPGWYCNDASGGQVFVASGSTLPDGVTC